MVNLPSEKLGSFYLGAEYDLENKVQTDIAINYDARDLTTHAVCVGMTGSGKTGLCIGLLEEAAMDKVPALIIDPKGDMTNLLLQFEGLSPEEFMPWINADDAARKGLSVEEHAKNTAEKWKNGLAEWGQGAERIRMLKETTEFTIYTPGSTAGVPINIMGSFAAPGIDFETHAEILRERIQGTVAALLGMIGNSDDPVRSREGILLSNLFEHYWSKNEDLDLTKLIMSIQEPPLSKLGVFDLETFYPQKERFKLAMDFNTLVASPAFRNWLTGDDLDIDKMYFTEEGKPRHSIFYIAHLSDTERMFFVTLLLNNLVSWMRRQSGTSSLRSLVYFDEIFGYFPPTANPPSKKPLMTILKQGRAFGLGAVLVTQNPVDIDYKGLSNAGTWFIGKMQTERDKARVLDGLSGAIAESGNSADIDFDKLISSLSLRKFLLHNVHADEPVVFNTRWVMSYLSGPMTRPQIKTLMENRKTASKTLRASTPVLNTMNSTNNEGASSAAPPSIDPSIEQRFFAVWKTPSEAGLRPSAEKSLVYEPHVLAIGKVRFNDSKRDVDSVEDVAVLAHAPDEFGRMPWGDAVPVENWEKSLFDKPDHSNDIAVEFGDVPETMNTAKEIQSVEKEFANWLYDEKRFEVLEHKDLKLVRASGESVNSFLMRIETATKELRDEDIDELQDSYEKKLDRIEDKIRKEERDLSEAEAEKTDRRNDELLNVASTVFGAVFGGRRSRSFSSVTSKRRMSRRASEKIEESKEDLKELEFDYDEMKKEMNEKLEEIKEKYASFADDISKLEIKPRRTDVKVSKVLLVWYPYWLSGGERFSAVQ